MNRREFMLGTTALAACGAQGEPTPAQRSPAAFPIRRGVNLGNALEAPREGEWGYRIEIEHLAAIAAAGFDGVRLPVRWDQHMDASGGVAPAHMERVAEIIGWATEAGLKTQLDVHHYQALIVNPRVETPRFLTLWRQISERFADAPSSLLFELLNEPNGAAWDGAQLPDLQDAAIAVIRESNPQRLVVAGPGNWQNIDALERWRPPLGENVAVSVHYYEPHNFTHQGAEWLGADAPRFGRSWGRQSDRRLVTEHIARAATWGAEHGYAIQLGEFGVNRAVPLEQRVLWTGAVRHACEVNGLGWCVWDFAGAFPIWNREHSAWLPQMRAALLD